MTHPSEEQLVAYRFGDVDATEAASIEEHLGACRRCRASLEAVDATLAAAARVQVPERSDAYGAEVWARLQPRLERASLPWWRDVREWLAPTRLAFAGGLAVLVLAAFVAGQYWPRPEAPAVATNQAPAVATNPAPAVAPNQAPAVAGGEAGASDKVRQQILLVAMGDHLERSQMALAELVNASDRPSVDISSEQAWARDLVVENRLYRQTAAETGDSAMTSVLDDLERVLVEVANSPSELSNSDFERVRQRIEGQGIIFKVRALGERVRDGEARPAADGRVQG